MVKTLHRPGNLPSRFAGEADAWDVPAAGYAGGDLVLRHHGDMRFAAPADGFTRAERTATAPADTPHRRADAEHNAVQPPSPATTAADDFRDLARSIERMRRARFGDEAEGAAPPRLVAPEPAHLSEPIGQPAERPPHAAARTTWLDDVRSLQQQATVLAAVPPADAMAGEPASPTAFADKQDIARIEALLSEVIARIAALDGSSARTPPRTPQPGARTSDGPRAAGATSWPPRSAAWEATPATAGHAPRRAAAGTASSEAPSSVRPREAPSSVRPRATARPAQSPAGGGRALALTQPAPSAKASGPRRLWR